MRTFSTKFMIGLGLGLSLCAWGAEGSDEPAPRPVLRALAQVDGAGVFLQQLLEGPLPGVTSTNLNLAAAPAVDQTLVLTRAQIVSAVRRVDAEVAAGLTNWAGADQVKVTRRARRLEESELKDLVTATLQRDQIRTRGELELRLGRPWVPVQVPDEPLQIRVVELPMAGVTPNFILRFELRTEREGLGTHQLTLQARVWRDVWVARSSQPRGKALLEADLVSERRDVLTLRDPVLSIEQADAQLELAESLMTGAPLLTRSVRVRPVVARGKVIDAVVQDGSMTISVKVQALEDGLPGQEIRVRNLTSKREFHAKVRNEQMVVVPL